MRARIGSGPATVPNVRTINSSSEVRDRYPMILNAPNSVGSSAEVIRLTLAAVRCERASVFVFSQIIFVLIMRNKHCLNVPARSHRALTQGHGERRQNIRE